MGLLLTELSHNVISEISVEAHHLNGRSIAMFLVKLSDQEAVDTGTDDIMLIDLMAENSKCK